MASYANQKDAFDSDTGLWNVSTTNGESGISGGARYLRRTTGAAWDETSMIAVNGRQPALLDGVEFVFTLDDLSTSGSDGTSSAISMRVNNGTTPTELSGAASLYIYPDGGVVKAHGFTNGLCTDLTLNTAMVQGEEYTCRFAFGSDGKVTGSIKGGAFGSSYVDFATPLLDAVTGAPYGTWRAQVNTAYIHSDISILNFEWYDSGGPDAAPTSPFNLPCDSLNGPPAFSEIELNGEVDFVSLGARTVIRHRSAGSWTHSGYWANVSYPGAEGVIGYFYFSAKRNGSNGEVQIVGIRKNGGVGNATGDGMGLFFTSTSTPSNGANVQTANSNAAPSGTSVFIADDVLWNGKFEVLAGGDVRWWVHQDDGTPLDQIDSGEWTQLADTDAFDATSEDLYFYSNGAGPMYTYADDVYFTDDGVITQEEGGQTNFGACQQRRVMSQGWV